jgi:hypothetical protein
MPSWSSIPTLASSAAVEASLLQAVADLQSRSQISDCIAELVTDVEIAVNLQEQVSQHQTVQQLLSHVRQQEQALEEARAVFVSGKQMQGTLADDLVRELWSLSQELGSLQELKVQHEQLVIDYNEVSARLFSTEEDLKDVMEQAATAVATAAATSTSTSTATSSSTTSPTAVVRKAATATAVVSDSNQANEAKDASSLPQSPVVAEKTEKVPDQKKEDTVSKETEHPKEEGTITAPAIEAVLDSAAAAASPQPPTDEPEKASAAAAADNVATTPATGATIDALEPDTAAPASPTAAAVVVLVEDEDTEEKPPRIEDLDTEIIMHVFGYLDALDILNTAQVNISMYSRVDSLFGLGGMDNGNGNDGADDAEDNDNSTIASTETPSTAPSTLTAPSRSTTATAATNKTKPTLTSTPASSTSPTATTATATATATVATLPPPPPTVARISNTASSAMANMPRGPGGIFSMLQTGMASTKASVSSPKRGVDRSNSAGKHSQHQDSNAAPMNAAMANSMAAKLTDGELNAIILMTERLKQKESLADKLVKENATLSAKLDGTVAVKQFLIAKVRDMEVVQATQEENETKVAQQIGSDQEVIAFLDGRVQELEAIVREMQAAKERTVSDLARVKEQSEKKAAVMGDMLQFERERLSESEREYKATKKVLVKEVKMNRAQILALQAERDGFREQNEVLRRAVISSGSSNIGGSPSYHTRQDRAYT